MGRNRGHQRAVLMAVHGQFSVALDSCCTIDPTPPEATPPTACGSCGQSDQVAASMTMIIIAGSRFVDPNDQAAYISAVSEVAVQARRAPRLS